MPYNLSRSLVVRLWQGWQGLPFAVEMLDERIEPLAQDPSVFGVDDGRGVAPSLPPTSLFALCSAASSK